MAFTKYTGKTGSVTVAFGAVTFGSWRKVTIAEKGKPATKTKDVTVQSDASYSQIDDPMGAEGSASCTVTVEGLLSSKDSADTGIIETAVGSTGNVVVSAGDTFTLTGATFKSFKTSAKIGESVPFTAVFELTTSAGAWS